MISKLTCYAKKPHTKLIGEKYFTKMNSKDDIVANFGIVCRSLAAFARIEVAYKLCSRTLILRTHIEATNATL